MSDPDAVLRELKHLDVTVVAREGRLLYRPRSVVDKHPALKARLVKNKDRILALLGADGNKASQWGWSKHAETSDLVAWFVDEGSRLLPTVPFNLYPWARVTNPARYRESIHFDISLGPDGPHNGYCALTSVLRRLRELFGQGAP